jgi:hypothetical protein
MSRFINELPFSVTLKPDRIFGTQVELMENQWSVNCDDGQPTRMIAFDCTSGPRLLQYCSPDMLKRAGARSAKETACPGETSALLLSTA